MIRFILKRLLWMIPTLWVVATITFFLMRAAPGGPFQAEREIPADIKANLERKYGLDRPVGEQYLRFLGNAVRLDFGPSYKNPGRSVREIIASGFPVSLELGAWSLLFALTLGIPIGVLAALNQNKPIDHLSMGAALLGVSIPDFVLGPLLIFVFSLSLYWLPPALWDGPANKILPIITLGSVYVAYIARLTRSGMLEIVRQDFIRTARAKGLSESLIVWRHALRGGLLPVVSFLGPAAARIITGAVVIEKIFAIPGLGRSFVDGAFNRDYTLVMGVVLFYASFLILFNLIVDVAYGLLDPRVRLT
ncbi:MAG: ABC transporter permease subunit [Candidatus Eisenbacteria bacterium]|nr:ABC transporter permease subunit [Candidatus Eisenbacteria bacterium]